MDSPNGPLDSPVSDIHIAKIAQNFIRKWEELAPYLRLLPAHEDVIKKVGAYDDQKREALRMWKRQNGRQATYRALIVVAKEVSDVELRKLSRFGTKREYRGENVRGLLRSNYYLGVAFAHAQRTRVHAT